MGWESKIRKVVPYTPGEQPKETDVIKLNTNENPYPPSPLVKEAAARQSTADLRLYPDPAASELRDAIVDAYGADPDEVFVGVGSDDVLAMCFLTFFNSDDPVLFPDITYSFYDVWAELFRIPYEQIPLDQDFRIRPEDYLRKNGGIVIANPNAPTGSVLELSCIEQIVRSNPDSIVIIDEAYIDFGGESSLPLIRKYDNIIVVRTFSKSRSCAGLRIGYAFAGKKLIRYLSDVKYSFNSYTMNRPSIELGTACIRDEAYYRECVSRIVATRERTASALRSMGFVMQDSCANFLFVTHPRLLAEDLFRYLKGRKIYVRWWNKPRISSYLRITIGTDEEMDKLILVINDYIGGHA